MVSTVNFPDELLNRMRTTGDAAADQFLAHEFADPERKTALFIWLKQLKSNQTLNQLISNYSQQDFIRNSSELPIWANPEKMAAGASFFTKHAEQIMQLLGLLSLPYCYAAADGALVLHLSEQLRSNTLKRLSDTAGFIWNVMSPEAFGPAGKGFSSCLAIRLTHAAARHYVGKQPGWSAGVPVNQEDMAGTNLAFSLLVVRGLRKLGHTVSFSDQEAFLHLWGVIGYLLGIEEKLIPADGRTATALERQISKRQFRESEHGKALTQALISCFRSGPTTGLPEKQVLGLMRYLLGEEVSELLGIPKNNVAPFLPGLLLLSAQKPVFPSGLPVLVAYKQKYQTYKKELAAQFPALAKENKPAN